MRLITLTLILTAAISAADINFSTQIVLKDPVGTPENEAQEIVAAVNSWRQRQTSGTDEQGNPILMYPTNADLAAAILQNAVRRIVLQECEANVAVCPTGPKAVFEAAANAEANKATAVNDLVVIE